MKFKSDQDALKYLNDMHKKIINKVKNHYVEISDAETFCNILESHYTTITIGMFGFLASLTGSNMHSIWMHSNSNIGKIIRHLDSLESDQNKVIN